MGRIDFDSDFIMQARNIDDEQALKILKNISDKKKSALKYILEKIAISDGFVHKKERNLIDDVFQSIENH